MALTYQRRAPAQRAGDRAAGAPGRRRRGPLASGMRPLPYPPRFVGAFLIVVLAALASAPPAHAAAPAPPVHAAHTAHAKVAPASVVQGDAARTTAAAAAKPERVKGYIVRAPWIDRPTGDDLENAYPAFAEQLAIPGHADLDCLVLEDGHLQCDIVSEAPEARSFGGAALTVARRFRMAPTMPDGSRTKGARTRLSLSFTPPKPDPLNP